MVGLYFAGVAATAVYAFTRTGDMGGINLLYAMLPWPWIGHRMFGFGGQEAGILLGIPLNAAMAFAIGYGISRLLTRR